MIVSEASLDHPARSRQSRADYTGTCAGRVAIINDYPSAPAVLVLGLVSPPREGLTLSYIASYTLLLAAVALVDQTAPSSTAPRRRRLAWLLVEIIQCSLVVRTQGTLIRPALIYLLPVGRAILLFGERSGQSG